VANAHRHPRPRGDALVSVVIATYNWSSVLAHAVSSALRQTYPNLEVIVVGDGCTDDSEEVVRLIGDQRVRWENLPTNSGSQSAPNSRGLELARGEYVAYLGHDDLWHPEHLAHLVAAIESSGKGLAIATTLVLGPPGSNYSGLVTTLPAPPSAALHRRDAVERAGGWRDYRTIVEAPDLEFLGRVAASDGFVNSYALTVWKFGSAMRRNSYVLRRDDEQAAYATRIGREGLLVERELATWVWLRVSRAKRDLPEFDPVPDVIPPGWHVRQYRRVRGLPEDPGG
jgi:glycosyltransferase involved in cell wall biosynthesis